MININGKILKDDLAIISISNRGYEYGDAVFETLKVQQGKILFWEDHYFRLMASMRIMRMEIPMNFTLEFIENEIIELINVNSLSKFTVRVKLIVNRREGGLYTPDNNTIDYIISTKILEHNFYTLNEDDYRVDLYKDFYIAPGLLSNLKTNNRLINVLGSIYAKENDIDNCLLLNTNKDIVETLNGNIFLVKGNTIKTPPLDSGCIKGVMRKQVIEILKLISDYSFEEATISPFELQKADELFLTNIITGIQPITHYRKKEYINSVAKILIGKLNVKIRLS